MDFITSDRDFEADRSLSRQGRNRLLTADIVSIYLR
jgi:hypothetical protein